MSIKYGKIKKLQISGDNCKLLQKQKTNASVMLYKFFYNQFVFLFLFSVWMCTPESCSISSGDDGAFRGRRSSEKEELRNHTCSSASVDSTNVTRLANALTSFWVFCFVGFDGATCR